MTPDRRNGIDRRVRDVRVACGGRTRQGFERRLNRLALVALKALSEPVGNHRQGVPYGVSVAVVCKPVSPGLRPGTRRTHRLPCITTTLLPTSFSAFYERSAGFSRNESHPASSGTRRASAARVNATGVILAERTCAAGRVSLRMTSGSCVRPAEPPTPSQNQLAGCHLFHGYAGWRFPLTSDRHECH